MEHIIQKIPFVRVAIALAVGIISGLYITIPSFLLLILIGLLLIFVILLNHNYQFRFNTVFGILSLLIFILTGLFRYQEYNQKPDFYEHGTFVGNLLESPLESKNSYKTKIRLISVLKNDSVYTSNETLLVYFSADSETTGLKPGDVIVFRQSPVFIKNFNNPYEFDYKKYLDRKKIYRQVYLNKQSWKKTSIKTGGSYSIHAEKLREKLLNIYRAQRLKDKEFEILSALTLGYKRELDRETKEVFSSAGAMHVLAVSGLHVGIVAWIISMVFGFLKRKKKGRFLFVLVSLTLIWIYTFITGLSPSVLRAATMFSILIIGDNLNRRVNFYNSLAASAFLILLIQPNNLFETGFQLSYSAVFGIVYLQPRMKRLLPVKHKILRFFIDLLLVSVAAQIATFPLTLYYFNQFPTYFWITNLFIIPVIMVLIPLGFCLLLVSKLSFIATALSEITGFIISITYKCLNFIEQLPSSTIETSINQFQLALIIVLLVAAIAFFETRNPSFFKLGLTVVLIIFIHSAVYKITGFNRKEMIVYNTAENVIVHLISGKTNYIFSKEKIEENDFSIQSIKNTRLHCKLDKSRYLLFNDTIKNHHMFYKNGFLFFEGKILLFEPGKKTHPPGFYPDFVINPSQNYRTNENLKNRAGFIYTRNTASLNTEKNHMTKTNGAFRKKW